MYRSNYNDLISAHLSAGRLFRRQPMFRSRPLAWFDKGPQEDAARVTLRNKETSAVTSHYVVDSREIVKAANTIYERLADDETPPEAA